MISLYRCLAGHGGYFFQNQFRRLFFESYCGSLISALTLGVAVSEVSGVLFPLAIAGCGLIASILGTFFVRGGENTNPQKALTKGSYASSAIVIIASLALSWVLFGNMNAAIAVIAGLIVGVIIGNITEYYTSADYNRLKESESSLRQVQLQQSSVVLQLV
jgi:Inorganic pyrophosphatase